MVCGRCTRSRDRGMEAVDILMLGRREIQVVVGVTAAVGLAISIAYGGSDPAATALKVYAYGTSISTFLILIYEHFIWGLAPIRKLTGKPDLRGTWLGELVSSYLENGHPIPPIPTILRITQTASSQHITLFTGESSSTTEQSSLVREGDGRWRLAWTYSNIPRASVRHRSDCHLGTAEVTFDRSGGLVGAYYTDRLTRGELRLPIRSKQLFASVSSAVVERDTFARPA